MPWCEDCERYWAPSAMTPEGECPDCGADLEAPDPDRDGATDDEGAPWHFKLLIVMLVVYLVYRGYEMFFA
jgi:hypothetical protein